jgi:hypothetical protein
MDATARRHPSNGLGQCLRRSQAAALREEIQRERANGEKEDDPGEGHKIKRELV